MGATQGFLRTASFNELTYFAADGGHHIQQHRVWWKAAGSEEFDHPKKSAPFWMGKTNALRKPALAASARRVKDRSWPKSDSQAGLLSRQTRPGKLSPGA